MSSTLVTIATFPNELEAQMAKNYLAENEVYAIVSQGEGSAVTGAAACLDVAEDEAKRAMKLLERRPHHHEPRESALPGDVLAAKALNVSTLGYFFIPVLSHLLSAVMLCWLGWTRKPLSEEGKRKAREARQINAIMLGVAAIIAAIVVFVGSLG
jgi:hypothetical protein